jgi:hypothetical protein
MIASAIVCANALRVLVHLIRWTLCPCIIEWIECTTKATRSTPYFSPTPSAIPLFSLIACVKRCSSILYLAGCWGGLFCLFSQTDCVGCLVWTAHLDAFLLLWARWLLLESHPCTFKVRSGTYYTIRCMHVYTLCRQRRISGRWLRTDV